jgi:hypothetical protein
MKIVAKLKNPNHPGGQRGRAGLVFFGSARAYEVTEEQLEAIKGDEYLFICPEEKEEAKTVLLEEVLEEEELGEIVSDEEEELGEIVSDEEEELEPVQVNAKKKNRR